MDEQGVSPSLEDLLQQAARLVEAGQKEQARRVIRQILLQDIDNLAAWEYLCQACYTPQEEIDCLERILEIQPDNERARQRLRLLRPPPVPVSPSAAQSPGGEPEPPPISLISPFTTQEPPPAKPPPPSRRKKKRREPLASLIAVCFIISCFLIGITALYNADMLPVGAGARLTATAAADCQRLIDQAMQMSEDLCEQIGPNQVCYGNNTLEAELIPGAGFSFSQRGDLIQVQELLRLSASPLDLSRQEWGIAIFRVTANLPRSLPGENVTLVVFGNTTLDNTSRNLESFYFSSELGQVVCEQVPFDGILITMPVGTGIRFIVNGAELTLMGSASLRANAGGEMVVSVYEGSASIVADGHVVYFGAGQSVSVPLGGANGLQADGPPSEPVPLSDADLAVACSLGGQYCTRDDIQDVNQATAQAEIASNLRIIVTPATTASPTPDRTVTPGATPTATLSRTPTRPAPNPTATPGAISTAASPPPPTSPPPTSPPPTSPPPTSPPPTSPPQGITICHCVDYHANCQTLYFASGDIGGHANHPNDIIPAPPEGCP
jgi:hypothetical protein